MGEHSGRARPPDAPPDPPAGRARPPDAPLSDSLAALCAAHGPVNPAARFPAGTVFGDWRLTAFIGRGGNGEVYCAEHVTLGTPVAVKVLIREEERAKSRFTREAKLLSSLKSTAFPRFYAYGEANGTAYLAMELLEPGDLPTGDKAIAQFLLKVCDAVAELHALGYVHRDIKPSNILWRTGTTGVSPVAVPVLADLGLVKDVTTSDIGHPESNVTLGGVGTPGYGAPEQLERGEVSFASDIHALGVLADQCFNGSPPRTWKRIIQRATSSIPAHRYPSVAAFARAIRWRNSLKTAALCLSAAAFLGAITTGALTLLAQVCESGGEDVGGEVCGKVRVEVNREVGGETFRWQSLCSRGEIESIEKRYMPLQPSNSGRRRYRVLPVTNVVEGTLVRLPAETVVFSEPIVLAPGIYRIMGPGRLDADISGSTNVIVRLKDCVLNNMTTLPYPKNGIRYVFEGDAYLNFARLKRGDLLNRNITFSDNDGDALEFGGPLTREELKRKRRADRERGWREEIERENRERAESYEDNTRIY